MEFTRNELKVLWYLKRHNPLIAASNGPKDSIIVLMAEEMDLRRATVSAILKMLEEKCLIVRTYKRTPGPFKDGGGYNPLVKIELIDPDIYLPPLPLPALATVVARENEELYERTAVPDDEIDRDAALLALVEENEKKQGVIDKLQKIIEGLTKEAEQRHRRIPDHLTTRMKDVLPAEVWDRLSHTGNR